MRRCIVHAGFPKTGTTSIQSSLLYGLRDPRFRFLTLDSDYGNLLVASAFRRNFGAGKSLFSQGVNPRQAAAAATRSRRHLDRSLAAAARRGVTPILSAEVIVGFDEASLGDLRGFLAERGWSPQVIAYVRPPFDHFASLVGQGVRANLWFARDMDALVSSDRFNPIKSLRRLEGTFGAAAVFPQWFEPASFPERCVVRQFCGTFGIDFRGEDVVRENDSLNLAALRFLYAMIHSGHGRRPDFTSRVRWRILIERLAGLPGPPMRLHACITEPLAERLRPDWTWLESRFGRSLPMTARNAGPDEGIRGTEDLLDFSRESLEWLARATGRPVVRPGRGDDTVRETVEQLKSLGIAGSPGVAVRLGRGAVRRRWNRLIRTLRNRQ